MPLPKVSCPAPQPALLFVLLLLPLLSALCSATHESSHNVDIAASASSSIITINAREENPTLLPTPQPFSFTEPDSSLSSLNKTPSLPPSYTFRLVRFQAITDDPWSNITYFAVAKALERYYETVAFYLLDLDHLEGQDLLLRFGDLYIDFYDVVEQLSILAVKAIVRELIRLVAKGLLGFVGGELVDVDAGVRMAFAFGLVGGP